MNTTAIDAVIVPPHPFFDFNDAPDRIERRHDKDELSTACSISSKPC